MSTWGHSQSFLAATFDKVAAFDERWTSTLNAPYLSRNSNHIRKEKSKEASANLVLSRVIITFSLFERFQTIISRSITTRWLVAAVVWWGTDGPSYLTTSAVAACAAPLVWLTLGGVVGTDGSLNHFLRGKKVPHSALRWFQPTVECSNSISPYHCLY